MRLSGIKTSIVEQGSIRKSTYLLIPPKVRMMFELGPGDVEMEVNDLWPKAKDGKGRVVITLAQKKHDGDDFGC
jgi:hypothetical protein